MVDMLDHNADSWQAFAAVLWPMVQQKMKESKLPIFSWISQGQHVVNPLVSLAVAILTTAGFHWQHTITADGGGVIAIAYPSIAVLGHIAGQMVVQHYVYKVAIYQPMTMKDTLEEIKKMRVASEQHLLLASGGAGAAK